MLIKATDSTNFIEVLRIVCENGQVLLESARRLTISADRLSAGTVDKIKRTGASVRPERQYALDS
ncbi:MAG: hypothetical protein NVV74_06595 [Magnetospirillum sp.]|nr:hypothetical protein [Magnetospirillum sp.]